MKALNIVLAFLGLATITNGVRNDEGMLIINPDVHTNIHVW